jgi:hypothetical protein
MPPAPQSSPAPPQGRLRSGQAAAIDVIKEVVIPQKAGGATEETRDARPPKFEAMVHGAGGPAHKHRALAGRGVDCLRPIPERTLGH